MRITSTAALAAALFAFAAPAQALESCQSFDGGQGCVSLDVPDGVIAVTDRKVVKDGVSASIEITKGSTVLRYTASAGVSDTKGKAVGPRKTDFSDVAVLQVTSDVTLEVGYWITTVQPASHNCAIDAKSGSCTVCSGETGTTCKRLHWAIRPVVQKAASASGDDQQ